MAMIQSPDPRDATFDYVAVHGGLRLSVGTRGQQIKIQLKASGEMLQRRACAKALRIAAGQVYSTWLAHE